MPGRRLGRVRSPFRRRDRRTLDRGRRRVRRRGVRVIDVLFNNAGIAGVGTVEETSRSSSGNGSSRSTSAACSSSRGGRPGDGRRARGGSIINMSSTIAEIGLAGGRRTRPRRERCWRSAGRCRRTTRHAASGSTRCCRARSTRRSWTATSPRATTTRRPVSSTSRRGQLTGDLGRPTTWRRRSLFLASDESKFVLGSGLFVDGGVRGAK